MSNRKRCAAAAAFAVAVAAFLGGCARPGEPSASLPAQPGLHLASQYRLAKARDIAILGRSAFVAENFDGMSEFDLADPLKPRFVRRFPPEESQPLDIAAGEDGLLYVADRFRGLVVWQTRGAEKATTTAELALPGIATHVEPFSGALKGHVAVACGGEGLFIVDARSTTAPTVAGRMNTAIDYSRWVAVEDNIVYLADNLNGGLKVVRIGNPASPELLFQVGLAGYSESVAFHDGTLYTGWRNYGARLFKVSAESLRATDGTETQSLRHLCTTYRPGDRVHDVLPLGRWFAVANDEMGVDLYDATNPEMPVLVDSHATKGAAMGLAQHHGVLYAAVWEDGLLAFEVAEQAK